jgi:glutamine amidotransferase
MDQLKKKDLIETIRELNQPVLGICLGMQMLMDSSEEGDTECLGVIPGDVIRLDTQGLISPHMGWNTLSKVHDHGLLKGLSNGDYFYFVHSYAVLSGDYTLAGCEYGTGFSAAIGRDNFYGVQFHPERSGQKGLQVLKNFLEIGQ